MVLAYRGNTTILRRKVRVWQFLLLSEHCWKFWPAGDKSQYQVNDRQEKRLEIGIIAPAADSTKLEEADSFNFGTTMRNQVEPKYESHWETGQICANIIFNVEMTIC